MDHHGTVVVTTSLGSFLYVVGGNNYHGVFQTVYVAPINLDGSLGAWSKTTPVPYKLAGQAIFVAHNRIFVAGGQNNGAFYDAVQSAPVNDDGTLGDWRAEPSLPAARFHAYAATAGDFVYITGGVDASFNATSTIYRAVVNPDGSLGSFVTEATTFPVARSHHAALVHGGSLFVVGGLTGNPMAGDQGLPEALSAAIAADGSLGAFSTAGTLSTSPITPSAFVLDEKLYVIGGIDDAGDYLSDIQAAAISGSALSSFAPILPGLPTGRSHVHQTPLFQSHFYSVGGSVDLQVTTSAVEIGTFGWVPRSLSVPLTEHPRRAASAGSRRPHCAMKLSTR